jgi:hypothetical protein
VEGYELSSARAADLWNADRLAEEKAREALEVALRHMEAGNEGRKDSSDTKKVRKALALARRVGASSPREESLERLLREAREHIYRFAMGESPSDAMLTVASIDAALEVENGAGKVPRLPSSRTAPASRWIRSPHDAAERRDV